MKPLIIGYVPPPGKLHSDAFLKNVRTFKTENQLTLFSDFDYGDTVKIGNPEKLIKNRAQSQKFLVSNALFFTACSIAISMGATHILYLESDSRVNGDKWDAPVFKEFESKKGELVAAGSAVCYNPFNTSPIGARRWMQFQKESKPKLAPIPTYGWKSANDNTGSCLFVNGSLGIYSIEWLSKLFQLDQPVKLMHEPTAWDQRIGIKAWDMFGLEVYNKFAHLNSIFSGYGNTFSLDEERKQWLMEGKCNAIHQVKDSWIPQ